VSGQCGEGHTACCRDVVEQLAFVLAQVGVVVSVQGTPDRAVGALKPFRI
jgi:hypothetical protein